MPAGDTGLEESHEAKEEVMELGDETEDVIVGGGIGTRERETSRTGSTDSEVMISQYLSCL